MIQDHVVSLNLAKKIYEAGIVVKSEFYWVQKFDKYKMKETGEWAVRQGLEGINTRMRQVYPAPLSSELGEILKHTDDKFPNHFPLPWVQKQKDGTYKWQTEVDLRESDLFSSPIHPGTWVQDTKEVDARAKALLYYKNRGIL